MTSVSCHWEARLGKSSFFGSLVPIPTWVCTTTWAFSYHYYSSFHQFFLTHWEQGLGSPTHPKALLTQKCPRCGNTSCFWHSSDLQLTGANRWQCPTRQKWRMSFIRRYIMRKGQHHLRTPPYTRSLLTNISRHTNSSSLLDVTLWGSIWSSGGVWLDDP